MNSYNGIIKPLYSLNAKGMKDKLSVRTKSSFNNGVVNENQNQNRNNFDFDELIKLPDYFAGTISSFDLNSGSVEATKHRHFLKDVIVDNKNVIVCRLRFLEDNTSIDLINIDKTNIN